MILSLLLCLIPLKLANSQSQYALDTVASVDSNAVQCLHQNRYSTIFVQLISYGDTNKYGITSMQVITNDTNSNPLKFGGTWMPYVEKGNVEHLAAQQVDRLVKAMKVANVDVKTHYIQVTKDMYSWRTIDENVRYLNSMLSRGLFHNLNMGIYTSLSDWAELTGNLKNLTAQVPLWYINVNGIGVTGETQPNYNDFIGFGPFSKVDVVMKRFASTEEVCGLNVNRNVY